MARRIRWITLVVVVLVAVGAVLAVVLVRPKLDDARNRVDATWTPLRRPLALRYLALGKVAQALKDAGATDRAVTKDLDAAVGRWARLARQGDTHTDPQVEATTANQLEALARRVQANVTASDKLKGNVALSAAILGFDQAVVAPAVVSRYNRAVRAYEDRRGGTVAHLVAGVLGYDSRPVLVLGP